MSKKQEEHIFECAVPDCDLLARYEGAGEYCEKHSLMKSEVEHFVRKYLEKNHNI